MVTGSGARFCKKKDRISMADPHMSGAGTPVAFYILGMILKKNSLLWNGALNDAWP